MRRTPSRLSIRLRSDDGVSLIHLGMLLLVLMGFSTFVMDDGVLRTKRYSDDEVVEGAEGAD